MKRRWNLAWVLAALSLIGTSPPLAARSWDPLPPRAGWTVRAPPTVSAPSWILYDATADWVITSSEPDSPRSPASTTKMMTAVVAVDHAGMDEPVTVSQTAADVGEAEIGLVAGETLLMGDLMRAALVRSANDAAVAIAEHVGGSVGGFAEMMNAKARELGLRNSTFMNPHGLDQPGHYSSAADLLEIEKALLSNAELAAIVRSTEISMPPAPDGSVRRAETTNHFLNEYQGALGVKTGFTLQAGLVLAAGAERGERRLLVVVMGSTGEQAHFADASRLLDFGFANARVLPVVRGYAYTVGHGSIDPVAAAARVQAMAWMAASGVLVPPPPLPEPEPVVVARSPEAEPDWRDALQWSERYWMWLVGER